MEGNLSRKIKTRDAAVKNIKKFFRDTVQDIYENYYVSKHSKLLAAERTLRIKYEKVVELSKEILDIIDENNFELEYEKSTSFDMFYHEKHIELAKFIKEKELDGSLGNGLDAYNPNTFKWSRCSDGSKDSRASDLAVNNSEYDTVNELTSNELTSDLLELFDGDSLDNDYDTKDDFDRYYDKTLSNQNVRETKLESYFAKTDNDSGHFSSDEYNTSNEVETDYIEDTGRGRNDYTYSANKEFPRELPRELPCNEVKESESYNVQMEGAGNYTFSTIDFPVAKEEEYKAYDTNFDRIKNNYSANNEFPVEKVTTNEPFSYGIETGKSYAFSTDIEYPRNDVKENKSYSTSFKEDNKFYTSLSGLESKINRPTYESYNNYDAGNSKTYMDTLIDDDYNEKRYESSIYEKNATPSSTTYSQTDYTYTDKTESIYVSDRSLYPKNSEASFLSKEPDYSYYSKYDDNEKEFDRLFKSLDLNDNTPAPQHKKKKTSLILPNQNVKKFDGDPKQWASFLEDFEIEINRNEDLSNMEKMDYLVNALSGEPERFLTSLSLCRENYVMAFRLLKERYDINEVQKKYK